MSSVSGPLPISFNPLPDVQSIASGLEHLPTIDLDKPVYVETQAKSVLPVQEAALHASDVFVAHRSHLVEKQLNESPAVEVPRKKRKDAGDEADSVHESEPKQKRQKTENASEKETELQETGTETGERAPKRRKIEAEVTKIVPKIETKKRIGLLNLSSDLRILIGRFLVSAPYFTNRNRAYFFACKNLMALERDVLRGNNAAVSSILDSANCNLNRIRDANGQPAPLQKYIRADGTKLTSLSLSYPELDSNEVLDLIATFPNLKALHIFKNRTDEATLISIGMFTQIEKLEFSHCKSIDNVLEQFQTRNITHLSLKNTALTLATVATVIKMQRIVGLELVSCLGNVEKSVIPTIFSSLTSLTELNLSKNRINNEIIDAISKQLSLQSLDLSGSKVAEDGSLNLTPLSFLPKLRELTISNIDSHNHLNCETIGTLTQLKKLDARDCNFTDERLGFVKNLINLEALYLDDNKKISDKCFSLLTNLKKLEVLSLSDCEGIKHPGMMVYLPKLQNLKVLYLDGIEFVNSYAFTGFPKLQNLRKLDFTNCDLNADAFQYFSQLANLTELNLCKVFFRNASFSKLGKLTQLKIFSLAYTGITDNDLLSLSELTNLRRLDLTGCNNLSDEAVQQLKEKLPQATIIE